MTVDLTGCRAKIERAQEHRELLNTELAPPDGRKPNRLNVSAKLDPESGYHVCRVTEIPNAWVIRLGVILGDIVHNSRGALDYLYWQLYCNYVGIPKDRWERGKVQFPIQDSCEGFAKKRKPVSKIPDTQWAVIREAQPYYRPHNPGNYALAVLRELSNRDKHQTLTPMLLYTSVFSLVPPLRDAHPYMFRNMGKFSSGESLEVGTEILDIEFFSEVDPEVEVAGYTAAHVLLPEGNFQILKGVDLMIATVRGIVDGVEAELP